MKIANAEAPPTSNRFRANKLLALSIFINIRLSLLNYDTTSTYQPFATAFLPGTNIDRNFTEFGAQLSPQAMSLQ